MKALSIHQPWAWAILHAGKNIENRTWVTTYRGPLLIHASKSKLSYEAQDADEWLKLYGIKLPNWESLPTGAIVGIAELTDCLTWGKLPAFGPNVNKWIEGPCCWVLRNARAFPEPLPYRGAQGLFDVPHKLDGQEVRL